MQWKEASSKLVNTIMTRLPTGCIIDILAHSSCISWRGSQQCPQIADADTFIGLPRYMSLRLPLTAAATTGMLLSLVNSFYNTPLPHNEEVAAIEERS
jgi:hypothetical protein